MKKRKKKKETSIFYRFTMGVMCCMLAFLVYLINDKEQIITMDTLAKLQLSDVNDILFGRFQNQDEAVAKKVSYQHIKDHFYVGEGNEVSVLLDGVIIKVTEDEIIQLCDNGVTITYNSLLQVNCKKDERVLKGTVVGAMGETLEMHFYDEDKEITMEEALHK